MTIKGFNRFVWDFEGSTRVGKPENVYGTYQSHGSMLIANSEEALKAHDINNGWDWTKIPGATTMSLTLTQTRLSKARNFSPRSSAGGVTYRGPEPLSSGVFGMHFRQPRYSFSEASHPYPNINLRFKKSVFFYQNVLVCLGSNIRINNGGATQAQTTLFQDKLISGSSSIEVDDERKDDSALFDAMTPFSTPKGSKRLNYQVAPTELPGLSTVRLMGVTSMQFTLILLHMKALLALIGKYNILMRHISYTGF